MTTILPPRARLIRPADPDNPIPPGTEGTVLGLTAGTAHAESGWLLVEWDTGSTYPLSLDDEWEPLG